MSRKDEKTPLREKCDELGIEYKSTDSIADLKGKIADSIVTPEPTPEIAPVDPVEPSDESPEVAEVPVAEVAEEPAVEEAEETVEEVVEPKPSKFIEGKFVENAPVLSATLVNGIMEVQTTVAHYRMSEEDYNNLK